MPSPKSTPRRSRRPVLRPGLRLTRRCDGVLQAGLHPPHRVGLDDSPLARRLAATLLQTDAAPPEGAESLLEKLADLLVDGHVLAELLQKYAEHPGVVSATVLQHGDAATDILQARAKLRVHINGPEPWHELGQSLLGQQGLGVATSPGEADVHLLLHVGEPDSGRADGLLRVSAPHVWAGTSAGEVTVGPFVDPGRTPCRRCVIAGLSSVDPGHALVREQYVARAGDIPEPADPALLTMAIAWAVREITAWAEGTTPATWGALMEIPHTGAPRERRFLRQPECGCSWTGAWLAG